MKKIFIAGILLISRIASAQTAATNTGIFYITGNSDIVSTGSDFTNNAGSALTNNGQLYIRGHLTNDQASVAVGTGTLYLNGVSAQNLNGSQPFNTFNFVSNNAAGIILNNNLNVYGVHTFSNGIISTTGTPNYLVYQAGSSYTGDGDARHVNGWVKKLGSTNFVYPVGNGTVERTVAINNLSANSEFNVRYLSNTPNVNQHIPPIRSVDWLEYWPITKVSGGTATVTLNWDYSKVYFPNWILPDIAITYYNGTNWIDNGGTAVGNVTTTGTITSNTISAFNLFTFGSKSWILPLTITNFNAARKDNATDIDWETEKELGTDLFSVERSDDASSFYTIATVNAKNSGKAEQYKVKDNAPLRNIAYYRLRITDVDRKESYSRIVAVTDGSSNSQLVLLNNPVKGKIRLLANSVSGQFKYQLTLMNGQMVQAGDITFQNNGFYEIPVKGNVLPGTYSLSLVRSGQSFNYKILITR